MTTITDPDGRIMLREMFSGALLTVVVSALVKLGIFEQLADGARGAEALAKICSCDPDSTGRLLRAGVSGGVLVEAGGQYSLNYVSRLLLPDTVGGSSGFASMFTDEGFVRAWAHLPDTVRTNVPGPVALFGKSFFEYLGDHPAQAANFDRAMSENSEITGKAFVEAFDFSPHQSIVDVGGGRAALMSLILRAHQNVRGLVMDLPHVVREAAVTLAEFGGRASVSAGSFFEISPPPADLYILKLILHDWDDERCLAILKHVRASMGPTTCLVVIDEVVTESSGEGGQYLFDMVMLSISGGRERSLNEWSSLFLKASLRIEGVTEMRAPQSIIHVRIA